MVLHPSLTLSCFHQMHAKAPSLILLLASFYFQRDGRVVVLILLVLDIGELSLTRVVVTPPSSVAFRPTNTVNVSYNVKSYLLRITTVPPCL